MDEESRRALAAEAGFARLRSRTPAPKHSKKVVMARPARRTFFD